MHTGEGVNVCEGEGESEDSAEGTRAVAMAWGDSRGLYTHTTRTCHASYMLDSRATTRQDSTHEVIAAVPKQFICNCGVAPWRKKSRR